MSNKNAIKCLVCGQFVSNKDLTRKVVVKHHPATISTFETTDFIHKKCMCKTNTSFFRRLLNFFLNK